MLFFRNTISNGETSDTTKGGSVFSAPFIHFSFCSKFLFNCGSVSTRSNTARICFIATTKNNTQDKQH